MYIMGNWVTLDVLKADVDAAIKKGYSGEFAFMPETVNALIQEVELVQSKVIAAEKIFSHFGGLSELMKLENGQGETAVDLIEDYLKL